MRIFWMTHRANVRAGFAPFGAGACSARPKRVPPAHGTHRKDGPMKLERAMGIEPTSEAWEASILPLNYARALSHRNRPSAAIPA